MVDTPLIDHLDHLVLTTTDREACVRFYTEILGMRLEIFGEGRVAFRFGNQKINLHERGREFDPKAHSPMPGSGDICLITSLALPDVIAHLNACKVEIIDGPVKRTGAVGVLLSVYFRDPDLNLIEVSNYIQN